jgi:hypothetical protein
MVRVNCFIEGLRCPLFVGTITVDAYFVPRVPQEKLLKCWITNIYKKVKATEDS